MSKLTFTGAVETDKDGKKFVSLTVKNPKTGLEERWSSDEEGNTFKPESEEVLPRFMEILVERCTHNLSDFRFNSTEDGCNIYYRIRPLAMESLREAGRKYLRSKGIQKELNICHIDNAEYYESHGNLSLGEVFRNMVREEL